MLKYACAYISVWSPMILMEFLFAPTVPSEPRPLEHAGDQTLGTGVDLLAQFEGSAGHIVDDADGEVVLGLVLGQVVIDGLGPWWG